VEVRVVPPRVAVKVEVWLAALEAVVALKVAVVAPAAMETVAGTLTLPLELRATTLVCGAAMLSATVQTAVPPAVTVAGLQARLLRTGTATTETEVFLLDPFRVAVRVEVWVAAFEAVVPLNVAVLAPVATDTVAGTATLPLEPRATTVACATAALRVTVQTVIPPAFIVAGLQARLVGTGTATTETQKFTLPPLRLAVTVEVWVAEFGAVVPVKFAVVAPAATDTVAGTVKLPLELRATRVACVGAAPRVTVQTAVPPAVTVAGLQERLTGASAMELATPPIAVVIIWPPSTAAETAPDTPTDALE
jgi:hypothetical protein